MSELYKLPDGWEWKKLVDKNVCKLIMGQSPSSDTYNSDGLGMPFFQGKTEFGEIYPTVAKYCTAPNKIAHVGDILLSVRAPVGPTNIANIECCIGRGLGAIRPNINNTLTNYLLYFFRNFELEISNKGKGSTFSAITKKELEDTDIPIPPLPEQQRIVSKLDLLFEKIDKSIALHQKNMDEADVFMGSVLNDIFGELEEKYKKYSLTKYVNFTGGSQPPKSEFSYVPKDGYVRLIQIRDYKSDKYIVYVNKKSVRKFCDVNDVMIGRYGPPVFQILRGIEGAYNVALMKAIVNEKHINKDFLFIFLKNPTIQSYIINLSQRAAGQSGVNKVALENYEIALPPLSVQQKVVKHFDEISQKIEKIKSVQKEKMDSLKALKASILDSAFRGEL